MNLHEPKNKNFIILILFMVIAVSGAKALHDSNVSAIDDEQKKELIAQEEVVSKQ